jgi:membrane protein YqaA with SNARE-associated domain
VKQEIAHRLAAAAPRRRHASALHTLARFGGFGLFAVSVVDASIIPLPVPGSTDLLLLVLVAHRANVWLMASAAITGSVLGGYFTWSTGAKGGEAAMKRHLRKRRSAPLERWMAKRGGLAVAVSALLPPPVPLLPFLLAAGALGVSRRKYFLAFSIGRTIRYGLIAWLGATYGRRMLRAWSHYLQHWSTAITWVVVALFVIAALFGLWEFRKMRRETHNHTSHSLAKS